MAEKQYSIVLVDDEEEVKKRIISKIPKDHGFIVVGDAANGYDAIDLIERLKPDVVITDIRMPFIDGIELSRIIRKNYPKTKIAFISGYDEFSYAKEAIDLDVISYLSKPVTEKEVIQFLDKLRARLDEERLTLFNQDRLDRLYKENMPALIENQFNSLLHLSSITRYDLNRFMIFNIDLLHGKFTVGMIEIDDKADFLAIEQLRIFLINILRKKFTDPHKVYPINSGHGLIFIIHQQHDIPFDLETILYDVVLNKKEFSSIKIRIGVSDTFDDFRMFAQYVSQAKKALAYSSYLNIGTVIYFRDVSNKKRIDFQLTKHEIDEISYTIKFGTDQEVDLLFDEHEQFTITNKDHLLNKQYYVVNIAHVLIEFSNSIHVDLHEVFEFDLLEKLISFQSTQEMFVFLKDVVYRLRSMAHSFTYSRANEVLDEAIAFLKANYFDPTINMDMVCDKLGVSVSYVSTLFKKLQNTTFNRYLVKVRMDKAKELLRYSNLKVYEIANQVGYNDVYYFSYSFKRTTGMTPKDYRNEQKTE